MMLSSTPAGDFLPVQAVWAGKTGGSLPTKNAEKMQEAVDRGFIFSSAKSEKKNSHFSTFFTMKHWVEDLMIAYIDLYAVHIGEEFRTLIFKDFPFIILIFVPGGCTGLFQPADMGLQRVAKHILKQDSLDYLVEIFKTQTEKGVAPRDIKFPSSLPILRDATVRGLVKMYDFFQTPDGRKIVQQAWQKCEVPGTNWNLSAECLHGKDYEKALRHFLREDTTLATEIANRCGATHLNKVLMVSADSGGESETALREEDQGNFETEDDSDVALKTVLDDALGIKLDVDNFSQHGPITVRG
ncbi:hypothetical protein C8F04DRAFT_1192813 [Mycena alexandri]|uniref:Uncharacterized protein n=1 Tax=Mycena alexandri TaxID=1745969 RepID=A0AAD6SAS8_9AGAR|nr:hypothetical protein C8F04DRAFT_1192813 [Mycena alexandri]